VTFSKSEEGNSVKGIDIVGDSLTRAPALYFLNNFAPYLFFIVDGNHSQKITPKSENVVYI
jgi:hypothetical protein